jgi:hypothetical protein
MEFKGISLPDDTVDLRTRRGPLGLVSHIVNFDTRYLSGRNLGTEEWTNPATFWGNPAYFNMIAFKSRLNNTSTPDYVCLPPETLFQYHIGGSKDYELVRLGRNILVSVTRPHQYTDHYETHFPDASILRYIMPQALVRTESYWL